MPSWDMKLSLGHHLKLLGGAFCTPKTAKSPSERSPPSCCIAIWSISFLAGLSIPWENHPKQQHHPHPTPSYFYQLD